MLSTARNAASSDSNSTRIATGEEDDESLPNITLEKFKEEFKERYRRLIPYMTFYVAHNFVNGQPPISQGTSAKDAQQVIPLVRKNQQANPQFARTYTGPRRENNYRANARSQEKFVPSVQYDPRNVGADNDYFTPVRYSSEKINYEYDSTPYQDQKVAVYPGIPTVTNGQNSRKENRYYGNGRPLRPYTTNGNREHLPRKQPTKSVHGGNLRDDYVLDYNVRPGSNAPINYPIKDFQDHRQVPVYPNTLELIPGLRQPSLLPQLPRNPNVNLEQILESFQLSERLPEMLNNDNIDNSLRTLVEILNILHSTKKEEFPQIQAPPLTPAVAARVPQKAANFKARPHTRPKVITESRFQATPNPIYLTDDPERYKGTSYEEEGRPKGSPQPGYNANSLTNNVVEYYIPVVQEIPTRYKETFLPTIRPTQPDEIPVDHSYAITEDIREDILQKEQFPFLTTESPTLYTYHAQPDDVSKQIVPQTGLKYGATRGKANVDYPAYSSIPRTNFSCKEQRYKGFFGDPETGCQVMFQCFSPFVDVKIFRNEQFQVENVINHSFK